VPLVYVTLSVWLPSGRVDDWKSSRLNRVDPVDVDVISKVVGNSSLIE